MKPTAILWGVVALFAVILFASLAHASGDPVADVRQIMAATVTTKSVKQAYLSGARDGTTAFQGALAAYTAVRAAEVPVAPAATPLVGLTAIADNFDTTAAIEAFPIAGPSPDDVGSFRMLCNAGKLIKDDPVVYPGQPGASHLHVVWGNQGMDAFSTYQSLRTTGATTCGDPTHPVNRTAYWMPAMLDGAGNVVKPDLIQNYYKQLPAGSAACLARAKACVALPNGIKYVYGWNPVTMSGGVNDPNSMDYWAAHYECLANQKGDLAIQGKFHTIADVVKAGCPAGAILNIVFSGPDCWDGRIDAPDHRSHLSYGTPETGGQKCPADHPYAIAAWQGQVRFTTDANFVAGKWRFSSDAMVPNAPAGTTLHFDYFEAWSPAVKVTWQASCIDRHATCSSGDLGNGTRIKAAESPTQAPHTLVPAL